MFLILILVTVREIGLVAYGLKYLLEYKNTLENSLRLEIAKKDYTGAVIELKGSDNPFVVTYSGDKDYKFNPVVGSEAEISLNASDNFSLADLYSSDEREYLISHYTNGILDYKAFLIPDDSSEPYQHHPYAVKIRATDLLGTLKGIPYLDANGEIYRGKQTFLQVIINCLSKTGVDIPISTCVNTYEESMLTGLNNDPLIQAKIDPARYRDSNGTPFSCFDVLKAVLNQFTASVRQTNGRFDITDITEFAKPTQRRRYYSSAGVFQSAAEETSLRLAPNGETTKLVDANHIIRIDKPYKMVDVYYQYGFYTSVLLNGSFFNFSSNTFDNWTNTGGLIVSYANTTDLYGAKINEAFNSSKYLKSSPISVDISDTITLSGEFATFRANIGKIKVLIGTYSLKQDGTWSTGDNYIEVAPPAPDRPVWSTMGGRFEITTSPAPISGNAYVQLYGTIKADYPTATQDINYFSLNVNRTSGSRANKIPKGEVFSVEQAGNYSYIPDKVLLLHGDAIDEEMLDLSNSRPLRESFVMPPDTKTSNIYRLDETTITSKWSRFGKTDNKPLGLIAAKNIINNYQKPLRFFEGSFKGSGLNPLQVFSISGLTGKFIVLSGSFDYKSATANLVLAEVVSDEVAVTERIYSDFGAVESGKSGISSPGGVPSSGGGIVGGLSGVPTLQDITNQGTTTDKTLTVGGLITDPNGIMTLPKTFDPLKQPLNTVALYFSETAPGQTGENPPITLRGLSDVSSINLGDGQALKWDATIQKFIPFTPGEGGSGEVDLSDYYNKSDINSFFGGLNSPTGYNKANWDSAYGWGNHASAGYALAASLGSSAYMPITDFMSAFSNATIDVNTDSLNGGGKLFNATNTAPVSGANYGSFLSFGIGGYSVQMNASHNKNADVYIRANGDGGYGDWTKIWTSLNFTPNTDTLQSVTARGGHFDTPISLGNGAYFLGNATYGFRFNDSQSLYNNVIFYENGNAYFRGNVGIETTNPSYKLDVAGSHIGLRGNGGLKAMYNGDNTVLSSYLDDANRKWQIDSIGSGLSVWMEASSAYVFRINPNGNVLIGNNLRFYGNTTGEGQIVGTAGNGLNFYTNDGNANPMKMSSNGHVIVNNAFAIPNVAPSVADMEAGKVYLYTSGF